MLWQPWGLVPGAFHRDAARAQPSALPVPGTGLSHGKQGANCGPVSHQGISLGESQAKQTGNSPFLLLLSPTPVPQSDPSPTGKSPSVPPTAPCMPPVCGDPSWIPPARGRIPVSEVSHSCRTFLPGAGTQQQPQLRASPVSLCACFSGGARGFQPPHPEPPPYRAPGADPSPCLWHGPPLRAVAPLHPRGSAGCWRDPLIPAPALAGRRPRGQSRCLSGDPLPRPALVFKSRRPGAKQGWVLSGGSS